MMNKKERPLDEAFSEFCGRAGFRRTLQRKIIYGLFYGGRKHLSVEEIMSSISQKAPELREESVYRILGDFEREGYIRKVEVPGVKKYERTTEKHGHFLCSKCGKISDVDISSIAIPKILEEASDITVTFNGVCPSCSKRRYQIRKS